MIDVKKKSRQGGGGGPGTTHAPFYIFLVGCMYTTKLQ